MAITLVMPLKINAHNDYDELSRFSEIQMKSFKNFLDPSILKEFIVITPPNDLEVVRKKLTSEYPEFPFNFVDENILIPEKILFDSGWRKQMLLKILAANIVSTPFYLTLDSDVYLTKILKESDLFFEEKLIFSRNPADVHQGWWKASCKILDFDYSKILEQNSIMGVTPEILVTNVCLQLQAELRLIANSPDFITWLLDKVSTEKLKWTEYSLYWVFLLRQKKVKEYYSFKGPHLLANAIWKLDDNDLRKNTLNELVERNFKNNKNSFFSLIQSNIPGLDQSYLAQLVLRQLEQC